MCFWKQLYWGFLNRIASHPFHLTYHIKFENKRKIFSLLGMLQEEQVSTYNLTSQIKITYQTKFLQLQIKFQSTPSKTSSNFYTGVRLKESWAIVNDWRNDRGPSYQVSVLERCPLRGSWLYKYFDSAPISMAHCSVIFIDKKRLSNVIPNLLSERPVEPWIICTMSPFITGLGGKSTRRISLESQGHKQNVYTNKMFTQTNVRFILDFFRFYIRLHYLTLKRPMGSYTTPRSVTNKILCYFVATWLFMRAMPPGIVVMQSDASSSKQVEFLKTALTTCSDPPLP